MEGEAVEKVDGAVARDVISVVLGLGGQDDWVFAAGGSGG